jgi:hypothetical protein
MRSCQGWVLAFSLFVASAAGADPGPNVRFADGGMSMVAITDRFRSASLHIGLEMGHTLRWGGFLELGALWPRRTPDIFASGGPLLGIGASFAVQFADAAAFLVTSGVAASWVGCHGGRAACVAMAGGNPSDGELNLGFGQWLTRTGLRLILFPDRRGAGLELFLGPHWRQGLGASNVDLPNGPGISLALGIGFHNK